MKKDLHEYYPEHVFRFCPRCGAQALGYDPDRSFRCTECGFHFYLNTASAVAAVIEDGEGRVLFTRRARDPMRGMLDLPGGFVDALETAEDALRREVLEELNLDIQISGFLSSFPNRYLFDGLVYFTLDLAFLGSVRDLTSLQLSDEISEVILLHPRDIRIEDIGLESIRNIVSHYLTKR
ncbi:MAG: NUDIX domain-containing protein [Desulfomonilia bacterium]